MTNCAKANLSRISAVIGCLCRYTRWLLVSLIQTLGLALALEVVRGLVQGEKQGSEEVLECALEQVFEVDCREANESESER